MAHTILLVDNDAPALNLLCDFLRKNGFGADGVPDGVAALEKLSQQRYDLLLSEIDMPRMKGFELLRLARAQYPHLKTALMTACNVNNYMRLARDENVGNIVSKTSPFNFDEVLSVARGLLTEDVFGFERYLLPGAATGTFILKHSRDIDRAVTLADKFFKGNVNIARISLVLREIITNAVFYGAKNEQGDRKEQWDVDVALSVDEYVDVHYGKDCEKFAVSVVDHKGRLKKKEVLYWLDRNISRGPDGLPIGMHDVHGRGLFISRETIDRFIVNIKKGVQTEVITIMFLNNRYQGFHPLLVNEF